jgi:hypothetical protein
MDYNKARMASLAGILAPVAVVYARVSSYGGKESQRTTRNGLTW